jgi:hypothetical protein
MSYQKISLVLCAVLATDALAETEATNIVAQPIEQPKPEYPASERERSRDGWVVLNYTISDEGFIVDPSIEAIRIDNNLSAFELAYSFITEGRIAGERGDKVEQLRCFRRAMLNQGRWLKRENYLKLLYATVVLEMQQQDFASALRDYELLTETPTGRKIAVDLEEPIQAVRALVESNDNIPPPYMVANMEMSIEHEVRAYSGYDDTRIQPGQEGSYPSGSSTSESSTN